jgi:NADPH-dependent 2,4-dienoyl-CoA reductase/sulfur reductase-like enzyme/nitrite reductase/ring-hydroxylating ferredoxin subunit
MTDQENKSKPDFRAGVALQSLADGQMVPGQVDGEDALLVRRGEQIFAVGAYCTHYHGALADGLIAGDTVRCPLHHACFSLRSGEALRAPAQDPIPCWRVERVGDMAYVREKVGGPSVKAKALATKGQNSPASVVIVGGGGAGLAAAEMLRREGYEGRILMISADDSPPCDRPNLSKDYLAGTAPDDWIPLRPPEFYKERRIELLLNSRVASLDLPHKQVQVESGKTYDFGALLIATGADPVKLSIPGSKDSQVHYLRTFADSKAIAAKAVSGGKVVVAGASFIGLEVAASLRARGITVHVVAPDSQPLERVMGKEVGQFIRELHESHGVVFHLGQTVGEINGRTVKLSGGATLDADFLVLGVGVRPAVALAERAGLAIDRGIAVNEYLETSSPGVFAAGDVARWPDPHTGQRIRVEHWVVAERQGQVAARNILGYRERFDAVPFFWSQHYDVTINYVGHAEKWDVAEIDGKFEARNCAVTYKSNGHTLAVATISRDLRSLQIEAAMETSLQR